MIYNKDYAKKVFELIPVAKYLVVHANSIATWSRDTPECIDGNKYWRNYPPYMCGDLGKVECDDWRESLIAREDVV